MQTFSNIKKTDFFLKSSGTWLTDPTTPAPTNGIPTFERNKALNQYYDRYNFRAIDEKSDLLYMTAHSEFECDPLAKTEKCLPLNLLFAAFLLNTLD